MRIRGSIFLLLLLMTCAGCRVDDAVKPIHRTKHVILIIVDGARYSETWGDSTRQYIPFRSTILYRDGVMLPEFRTAVYTYTSSGHDALCTGYSEPLDNGGNQFPQHPSFFQYWRKATHQPAEKAWIITSKDKLFVLANCRDSAWQSLYTPRYDCGNNGPFTGYRPDSITCKKVLSTFATYHPDLLLVNFREPDFSAHANNWPNYLAGIRMTDQYIGKIWEYIQSDPYYKNSTTLIVTNDHGRHLDGWLDGFVSHGDNCNGCRHIEFIAAGPDFKNGTTLNYNYSQVDIPTTIAELMGFEMHSPGKVMKPLFK